MKTVFVSLLIAGLLSSPIIGNAQADDDIHGGGDNSLGSGHMPRDNYDQGGDKALDLGFDTNRTPTEVPFDGGASLLLIAGAAYGAKKAASRVKANSTKK